MSPSLLAEHKALLTGRWLTDLANTTAFIFTEIKDLNWVGFYLLQNSVLHLGPFQGKPACTEIPMGKGVCGTSALQQKSLLVPDVHVFSGHITCDPISRSELVVPLISAGELLGVLDLDSPLLGRFVEDDRLFFESLVKDLLLAQALPLRLTGLFG